MLANAPIAATIPASDLERAKQFYAEKLGLSPVRETPNGYMYACGDGTEFVLYATTSAGQAQHTLAGWNVEGLESVMTDLRSRGVVFEEYDMPGLQTVNGIATMGDMRGAWFRDSEGNILALTEM
jgi:catechol 2,3-dioxygenase-like lactoylglutathione lyase family enzyme